jgi:ferric-dicitrate binding protein FerR (iron transport regulator)
MNEPANSQDEQKLALLLRAAGPREPVPLAARARWEATFRQELAPVLRRRQQRRRWVVGLAGAAAAMLLVLLAYPPPPEVAAPPLVTLDYVAGAAKLADGERTRALAPGQALVAGNVLLTAGDGHLALRFGVHRLRLDGDSRLTLQAGGVYLHRGRLYVSDDAPPGRPAPAPGRQPFAIVTPWGQVRDIGTQFLVAVGEHSTRATVRRGAIEMTQGNSRRRAAATAGGAVELRTDSDARISEQRAPASGERWQWIYQSTPPFTLEGSSVLAFLEWVSAETGLVLAFESSAAHRLAAQGTLHGAMGDWDDPQDAIGPVLAATDLRAEVSRGQLHVRLR